MNFQMILVLTLSQLIAVCRGSNISDISERYYFTKHLHGKNYAALKHVHSWSFLHCCSLCHESEGCRGVAYSPGDCLLLSTLCPTYGECPTCRYKMVLHNFVWEQFSYDCKRLLEDGNTEDGEHIVSPNSGPIMFLAYCDMSNGGWQVIQRRVDDSVDFYRGWKDYVTGFGDFSGSFWAGLEILHALTKFQNTDLLVTMERFDGATYEAYYCSFHVGDAASGYRLSVGGYSGTAGDSMRVHNQQPFSTYDNDQDASTKDNCAERYHGGWWYNDCFLANPNGLYIQEEHTRQEMKQAIKWTDFNVPHPDPLRFIQLKVRRII